VRDVDEIEKVENYWKTVWKPFQANFDWKKVMKPYPKRKIILPNGDEMVVRSQGKEEIEEVVEALMQNIKVHKQFFDLIAAEMCMELMLWREGRPIWDCHPESHFNLVGEVNGEIVGSTNGVLSSPKIGNSLHTTVLKSGLQIGAQLWMCKLEHYFDVLGIETLHASAESPRGAAELFEEWGFEHHPDERTHFGSALRLMTKKQWNRVKVGKMVGKRIE
jgi:hypothetical protein